MQQQDLKVKIYADGADKAKIMELYADPMIQGFTTNPTLMHQVGIKDYETFAKDILASIRDRPISFEVFSDDFAEMERQALKIASWGENVYVKIPITNTKGESALPLVKRLVAANVKLNVTAIFTNEQIDGTAEALAGSPHSYISIFAGRIADAGQDPIPYVQRGVELCKGNGLEVIWASPRELLNIVQASDVGCHVITVTPEILKKLPNLGRDLEDYSLDTVKMFFKDGVSAGFAL